MERDHHLHGQTAYKMYRIGRCWAHVLREADHIAEHNPNCRLEQDVTDALRRICQTGLGVEGSPAARRGLRDTLRKRTQKIIDGHRDHPVLEKFMAKLFNALSGMFLFVINPAVPAINNAAERGLREMVVYRKVRGSIRSEKTMD